MMGNDREVKRVLEPHASENRDVLHFLSCGLKHPWMCSDYSWVCPYSSQNYPQKTKRNKNKAKCSPNKKQHKTSRKPKKNMPKISHICSNKKTCVFKQNDGTYKMSGFELF